MTAESALQGIPTMFTILTWTAQDHAIDMQIELSPASIPFIITSGVRFFEQSHI